MAAELDKVVMSTPSIVRGRGVVEIIVALVEILEFHVNLFLLCMTRSNPEHPTNAYPILQEIEPQRYQPPPILRPQQPMEHVQQSSTEELVKQMTKNNLQFQENVSTTIQDL
ncbi:hypothetical protein CR513_12903, partial [Mucuna pruriens]